MEKTILAFFLICGLTLLTSCSKGDEDEVQPPQKVTRWECILFGSYPANEVVSGSFDAVDSYALPAVSVQRCMPSAEVPSGRRSRVIAVTPSGLCVPTAIRPVTSLISATSAICIIKVRQSLAMMPPCCLPSLST